MDETSHNLPASSSKGETWCSLQYKANLIFRFTDFLVFEVDLDGNVIHLKSLAKPQSSIKKPSDQAETSAEAVQDAPSVHAENGDASASGSTVPSGSQSGAQPGASSTDIQPSEERVEDDSPWPDRFTTKLSEFLSPELVEKIKTMYLEGPEPPFVSDNGWGGRQTKLSNAEAGDADAVPESEQPEAPPEKAGSGSRGRDRGGRGRRGGRGGRGGRHATREDHRKVVSDVRSALDCCEQYTHRSSL